MPTATLTWSAPHGDSNLQSTFSATNQGAIQLLNQYLTALAVFADFPWEVCSFEGATAPWFVTLKRKNGNPGRIVFIGVTTAPNTTYNPQFGTISWVSPGVRAAFFPNATSDTPANILATSGDVFTNPAGCRGLGPVAALTSGASLFNCHACEDGLFLKYGSAISITTAFIVGDLIEDGIGNQDSISILVSGGALDGIGSVLAPTVSTTGGFYFISGTTLHFGTGWAAPASIAAHLRDSGPKSSWFLPRSVCSFGLPLGAAMKFKLRQIAYGPTPLAANETLTDTGSALKAISMAPNTAIGPPWLTNFKV